LKRRVKHCASSGAHLNIRSENSVLSVSNPVPGQCNERSMGKTETEISTRAERAHSRRTTMYRKITLALVAAASLSAMALAPSAASAKPWGGGWGGGWGSGFHHHHFHPGFGIAYVGGYADDGCYVTRRVRTPFGVRLRTVNVCY
jgi:hypothetical protein